jgi:hypothetical protein
MDEEFGSIEEMKESWRLAPDAAIMAALEEKWGDYTPEAQAMIIEEAANRGITIGEKQISGNKVVTDAVGEEKEGNWLGTVIGFACLALLCLGVNGILWMYYEWRDSGTVTKIEQIEVFLQNEKAAIDTLEQEYLSNSEDLEKFPGDPNLIFEILLLKEIAESSGDPDQFNKALEDIEGSREFLEMALINVELLDKYEEKLAGYNIKVEEYKLTFAFFINI